MDTNDEIIIPSPDDESDPLHSLTPRQRKLCELAAQGKTNNEICKELGYSASRVSILINNPLLRREIVRFMDMLFEETVVKRLKRLGDPAISNIEECITDDLNRFKPELKMELSRWVIEKLDGKPAQKIDVGENLLGVMLDRLDNLKNSGKSLFPATSSEPRDVIELSPADPPPAPKVVEPESVEYLTEWVTKNT